MSQVGNAVGGFFDGLFGGGSPAGLDRGLMREQEALRKQQEAQLAEEKKRLERQRIAALKGRFSTSAGGSSSNPADTDAEAASLFSRITGRE